jgi:hypothetical protein
MRWTRQAEKRLERHLARLRERLVQEAERRAEERVCMVDVEAAFEELAIKELKRDD